MSNRYNRLQVLSELSGMMSAICENVFVSTRPTAMKSLRDFIVVRLGTIESQSSIHSTVNVQIHCFTKDRDGGVEAADRIEDLIDGVLGLIPFDNELFCCNESPLVLPSVADGMGYHAVIIQFRIIIKQ